MIALNKYHNGIIKSGLKCLKDKKFLSLTLKKDKNLFKSCYVRDVEELQYSTEVTTCSSYSTNEHKAQI